MKEANRCFRDYLGGTVYEEGDFGSVSDGPLIQLLSGEAAKIQNAERPRALRRSSGYAWEESNPRPSVPETDALSD